MTLSNLLATNNVSTYILLGAMVLLFVGLMLFQSRSQKKRQQEMNNTINKLEVGTKIKTIGGVYGTIIYIDETTFVLETGMEGFKSYLTFDKNAFYSNETIAEQKKEEMATKAENNEVKEIKEPEEVKTEEKDEKEDK